MKPVMDTVDEVFEKDKAEAIRKMLEDQTIKNCGMEQEMSQESTDEALESLKKIGDAIGYKTIPLSEPVHEDSERIDPVKIHLYTIVLTGYEIEMLINAISGSTCRHHQDLREKLLLSFKK